MILNEIIIHNTSKFPTLWNLFPVEKKKFQFNLLSQTLLSKSREKIGFSRISPSNFYIQVCCSSFAKCAPKIGIHECRRMFTRQSRFELERSSATRSEIVSTTESGGKFFCLARPVSCRTVLYESSLGRTQSNAFRCEPFVAGTGRYLLLSTRDDR